MNKVGIITLIVILIALIAAAFSFTTPLPPNDGTWITFHVQLAFIVIMTIFYIGIAILYLLGLYKFTLQAKVGYIVICIGFLILAIAQIQLPILQALNLWESAWVLHGGLDVPYVLAGLIMFGGLSKFSKMLSIKTQLSSWLISGIIITLLVCIFSLGRDIFYPYQPGVEAIQDSGFIGTVIPALLFSFASLLILKIKQNINNSYTNALAWFFIGMVCLSISEWQVVFFSAVGFNSLWVTQGYFDFINILPALALLKAGYAFNKIKIY